jgi:Ca-activated chloride channel family protein
LARRRRSRAAVRFSSGALLDGIAERGGSKRAVVAALALAALACLPVALAHPQRTTTATQPVRTVVVALDVSNSMAADDVAPSRLDAATSAVRQFLAAAPDDVAVGLVRFAGTVVGVTPPDTSRAEVTAALDAAELRPGTAVGDAVNASLELLTPPGGEPAGAIVVVSDGFTTAGATVATATANAVAAGVPVSTISFGTPDGTILGDDGSVIPVPAEPDELAQLAAETGGGTYTAASAGSIERVFDDLAETLRVEDVVDDYSWVATAAAGVLLAAACALSLRWFGRLL